MVGRIRGASFSVDRSADGDQPCIRLLVLPLPREKLPAYSLPLIARSGDSRLLADLALRFPGGSVDLTLVQRIVGADLRPFHAH